MTLTCYQFHQAAPFHPAQLSDFSPGTRTLLAMSCYILLPSFLARPPIRGSLFQLPGSSNKHSPRELIFGFESSGSTLFVSLHSPHLHFPQAPGRHPQPFPISTFPYTAPFPARSSRSPLPPSSFACSVPPQATCLLWCLHCHYLRSFGL